MNLEIDPNKDDRLKQPSTGGGGLESLKTPEKPEKPELIIKLEPMTEKNSAADISIKMDNAEAIEKPKPITMVPFSSSTASTMMSLGERFKAAGPVVTNLFSKIWRMFKK